MAKDNGFSIENVKAVLDQSVDVGATLPQEVPLADFKRAVAKTIQKIHPLALNQFVKGMEEIGVIRVDTHVAVMLMYPDDL